MRISLVVIMAGYIGKIEPFDEGIEKWSSYQERLEKYFAVNDIANENDKKVSALLTLLGGKHIVCLETLQLQISHLPKIMRI